MALLGAAAPVWSAPTAGVDGFRVGSFVNIRPALSARVQYDDNIFRQPNDAEGDIVTQINPTFDVTVGASGGANGLSVQYRPEFGAFQDNSDESIINHDIGAAYRSQFSRMDLELRAGFAVQHEPRGTGVSNGLADFTTVAFDEPARFHQDRFGVSLGNIGRGARTRIGVRYDQNDIEYQNFRDITRARDRTRQTWQADLGYRVGGATYANFRTTVAQTDYDFTPAGLPELDSDETRFDLGFVWESTGITTSRASIGYQEKDFESGAIGKQDQFVWDLGFLWQPNSFTSVEVSTGKQFNETNREGTAVSSQNFRLGYRVGINDRLSTTVGLAYGVDDYQDDRREDDFASTSIRVDYNFRRWLNLGAGVEREVRGSNQIGADFDRNVVFVSAQIGL